MLIARLLGAPVEVPSTDHVFTTTYWYYRACRAAVSGGAGKLSGPFAALDASRQATAIEQMLALPDEFGLPDPRRLVPEMVGVAGRHPQLNVLNTEAAAAARMLDAVVVLSPDAARGALPDVLGAEGVPWVSAEMAT